MRLSLIGFETSLVRRLDSCVFETMLR